MASFPVIASQVAWAVNWHSGSSKVNRNLICFPGTWPAMATGRRRNLSWNEHWIVMHIASRFTFPTKNGKRVDRYACVRRINDSRTKVQSLVSIMAGSIPCGLVARGPHRLRTMALIVRTGLNRWVVSVEPCAKVLASLMCPTLPNTASKARVPVIGLIWLWPIKSLVRPAVVA